MKLLYFLPCKYDKTGSAANIIHASLIEQHLAGSRHISAKQSLMVILAKSSKLGTREHFEFTCCKHSLVHDAKLIRSGAKSPLG